MCDLFNLPSIFPALTVSITLVLCKLGTHQSLGKQAIAQWDICYLFSVFGFIFCSGDRQADIWRADV